MAMGVGVGESSGVQRTLLALLDQDIAPAMLFHSQKVPVVPLCVVLCLSACVHPRPVAVVGRGGGRAGMRERRRRAAADRPRAEAAQVS